MATLCIFSGLPGSGKTTLSKRLASHMGAVYLRIDTIEQAFRDLCNLPVEGEGYRLAYRIAADNLRLGLDVVADSCNPIALSRREWEQTALDSGAAFINIEVICSDPVEHRHRVESRTADIAGLTLPTWEKVINRDYQPWSKERIVMDTAGRSEEACLTALLAALAKAQSPD